MRLMICFFLWLAVLPTVSAQTIFLSISSDDYQVTNVFSDIDTFNIDIEINTPLTTGVYMNPEIVSVVYSVSGVLASGTPSGFTDFALQRNITGSEFYAQGSSINFEISQNAVLSDGVQVTELVGNGIVFTFNGREIGNGRFHPALFELDAAGTGQIQNSNNVITENPLQQINFGDEYITDLMFDPGNTTLITEMPVVPTPTISGGGGATSPWGIGVLVALGFLAGLVRRRKSTSFPLAITTVAS